jgi:hypothetical protein
MPGLRRNVRKQGVAAGHDRSALKQGLHDPGADGRDGAVVDVEFPPRPLHKAMVEHRAVAQRIEDMNELHDAPPAGAPMIFMARLTQDLGDEFEPAARANAFANAMIAVTSERQRFRFQGRRLALCIDEVAHRQFHDAYGPLLSTRSIDRPSGGSSMSAK